MLGAQFATRFSPLNPFMHQHNKRPASDLVDGVAPQSAAKTAEKSKKARASRAKPKQVWNDLLPAVGASPLVTTPPPPPFPSATPIQARLL